MKPTPVKYTLLAVGIATAMGATTVANAATQSTAYGTTPSIANVAEASYKVGDVAQPTVKSNEVTITVSEQSQFTLVATMDDGTVNDDKNEDIALKPKGTVTFNHKLTNDGNREDNYSLAIDNSIPGDDFDYSSVTNTTVKIFKDNGTPVSTNANFDINSDKVTLKADEYAEISYTVQADDNADLGSEKGKSKLTATSEYVSTQNGATDAQKSVSNTNTGIITVPVFKIAKTGGAINLNEQDATGTYTITISNADLAYSDDAKGIVIRDAVPEGLYISDSAETIKNAMQITTNNSTIAKISNAVVNLRKDGNGTSTTENDVLIIRNVDLGKGDTISITFKVKVSATETLPDTYTNHAKVYDDITSDTPPTGDSDTELSSGENVITDSTDDTNEKTGLPTDKEGEGNPGEDSPATTSPTKERKLKLTGDTDKEVPPVTTNGTQATYTPTLKNTGQQIEGTGNNDISFTITSDDTVADDNISPVDGPITIIYDPDPNTPGDELEYQVADTDGDGSYNLSDATPTGTNNTPWSGMQPGSEVKIKYDVKSETKGNDKAKIGDKEKTTVTITPKGADAPTVSPSSNTTTVQGLKLVKKVGHQTNCTGTPTSFIGADGTAGTLATTVAPGDCAVYVIEATNTFTSTSPAKYNLTDVVIYDETNRFTNSESIQVVDNSWFVNEGSGDGTASSNGSGMSASNGDYTPPGGSSVKAIYTSNLTIAPTKTYNLTFKVKNKSKSN